MEITRYIVIKAVQTESNELIPVWDERVLFEKTEMYGNQLSIKDKYGSVPLVECVFDLKTKKVSAGIELDSYPSKEELPFKVGDSIYYEKSHRKLLEATISDIVYEEFEMTIYKGKKIDSWIRKRLPDVQVEPASMYAIKNWKPFYVLDNGETIKWEHQLYHKHTTSTTEA